MWLGNRNNLENATPFKLPGNYVRMVPCLKSVFEIAVHIKQRCAQYFSHIFNEEWNFPQVCFNDFLTQLIFQCLITYICFDITGPAILSEDIAVPKCSLKWLWELRNNPLHKVILYIMLRGCIWRGEYRIEISWFQFLMEKELISRSAFILAFHIYSSIPFSMAPQLSGSCSSPWYLDYMWCLYSAYTLQKFQARHRYYIDTWCIIPRRHSAKISNERGSDNHALFIYKEQSKACIITVVIDQKKKVDFSKEARTLCQRDRTRLMKFEIE